METVLYIILVLILALSAYAAIQPKTFRLERSTTIKAPPEKVFALVNDFRQWGEWSPWDKMDPNMTRNYGGSPSGVGSTYGWVGNKKVGEGSMEIVGSNPGKAVSLKLDFLKPFEAHNMTDFTFTPEGDGTRVNWAMHGPLGFAQRLMHIFFNMEKMVGPDFERGLASMKQVAER
jgi:uncharacterized protein YndB with AHSA1/START domain